jgi:hypothetical protein
MTHTVKCFDTVSDQFKGRKWVEIQTEDFNTTEEASKQFQKWVSISFDSVDRIKIVQYIGKQVFKIFQIN